MTRASLRPHFTVRFVLLGVLCASLAACGGDDEPPFGGSSPLPRNSGSAAAQISERVRAIIAESERETIETDMRLPDGSTVAGRERRPRTVNFPRSSWEPPEGCLELTSGEEVARFKLDQWPADIAVDSSGRAVVAAETGVLLYDAKKGTEPRRLMETGADVLQWSGSGEDLLIGGRERSVVLRWSELTVARDVTELRTSGYLQFAPSGEGFWQITEHPDFNPEAAVRIGLDVSVAGGTPGGPVPPRQPAGLAKLGTLPLTGEVWGHQLEYFQMDPVPAGIWFLTPSLERADSMTTTVLCADLDPVAGRDGRAYFIRTRRRGARDSRAWTVELHKPETARALTAEPTYDVAVSPGGEWLLTLHLRADEGVLVRNRAKVLLDRDLSRVHAVREEFERNAVRVMGDIESAFAETDMGQTQKLEGLRWKVEWPPDEALMLVMDRAFREALRKRLGFDPGEGAGGLSALDDFLDEINGQWPESPALVVALAAFYGDTLDRLEEAEWYLDTSLPDLGQDLTSESAPDDTGFLFTLHSPFQVARERLAGRMMLDAAARRVLAEAEAPIGLVENFRPETARGFLAGQAANAGLKGDEEFASSFEHALMAAQDNDAAAFMAWAHGLEKGDGALAVLGGLQIARLNPAHARALTVAAKALQRNSLTDPALMLFGQAERLSPADPGVLLDAAVGYLDEDRLDDAEARLERIKRIDQTGEFSGIAAEYLDQVKMLRPGAAQHTGTEQGHDPRHGS